MNQEQLQLARRLRGAGPQNFHPSRWYRIDNITADTAEVYIYDEIGYFGITADDFIRDVQAVHVDNLTVRLNSKGGDVFEALAMHAFLAGYPGTVTAIVDSVAASAASFLIAGADTIQIQRNASVMVHDASLGAYGNAEALRSAADLLDMASNNIADIYSQRGTASAKDWRAVMQSGDVWYTAEEALEAGLVDEVLDNSKKKEAKTPAPPAEEEDLEDLQGFNLAALMRDAFNTEGVVA